MARLFARHLKASPSAVARTARIQRAKRLIDETDKPMVEIAVIAGFGSLRRFNAMFAEVYGRAPTEIRRNGKTPCELALKPGQATVPMIRRQSGGDKKNGLTQMNSDRPR